MLKFGSRTNNFPVSLQINDGGTTAIPIKPKSGTTPHIRQSILERAGDNCQRLSGERGQSNQKVSRQPSMEIEKPRFGISDLLILTTSVCIYVAVVEQADPERYEFSGKWGIFLKSIFAVFFNGLAFGGMGICFVHWIKTKRLFDHPGYRIWFFSGIQSLTWLSVSGYDWPKTFNHTARDFDPNVYVTIQVLPMIVAALILLYSFSSERWWWQVSYLSVVAHSLTQHAFWLELLAEHPLRSTEPLRFATLVLASTLLIIGVICDDRAGLKRDWIHFTGIALFLLVGWTPACYSLGLLGKSLLVFSISSNSSSSS